MSDTKKYVIDFTKSKGFHESYSIIAEALEYPSDYGCNLDALYDLLTEVVISEKSHIEIHGLEALKKYGDYDEKIYEVFLGAKHAYGKEAAQNFQVTFFHGDGSVEILPDELKKYYLTVDFRTATTEADVINALVIGFELSPEHTKSFSDVWHELLSRLHTRITLVSVYGLEKLKEIADTYETTLKILNGIKENWGGKYSDRFFATIIHENGES